MGFQKLEHSFTRLPALSVWPGHCGGQADSELQWADFPASHENSDWVTTRRATVGTRAGTEHSWSLKFHGESPWALSLLKAATCAAISKNSVLGWDLAIARFQPSIVYSLTTVSMSKLRFEDWGLNNPWRQHTSDLTAWWMDIKCGEQFSVFTSQG